MILYILQIFATKIDKVWFENYLVSKRFESRLFVWIWLYCFILFI